MPRQSVKIGFEEKVLVLPIDQLVALKEISTGTTKCRKYKQIEASLIHVGLIEPLAVFPHGQDRYLVLNGNLRLGILKILGAKEVACTIALDDEAYTYNKHVNGLSPIAEHFMILKAIANGVTEARIAAGLNVDVESIRHKRNLLDGICPEAVDLLRNKRAGHGAFSSLRKMKPLRQIEAAELMLSGNNFSTPFAAAILRVTRPELLVEPIKKSLKIQAREASDLLGESTDALLADLATIRRSYGVDVLTLSVICRSLEKLIAYKRVERYLQQNHADTLEELRRLIGEVNRERAQPTPIRSSSEEEAAS
jgi:nucleoside diphosphate kinase